MSDSARAIGQLNKYSGTNIWEDLIWHLLPVDGDATAAADPAAASNVVVFRDGSIARFDDSHFGGGQWIEAE